MSVTLKKAPVVTSVAAALLFLYLLSWPTAVDPASWDAPDNPGYTHPFGPNTYLTDIERIPTSNGNGPEDIAVDSSGRIYGGLENGKIIRHTADGTFLDIFADTGGRPLGLHFDAQQHLIVADGVKGLLSIAPDGEITTLTNSVDGAKIGVADDLDIASDGIIYFSDASDKFPLGTYKRDALEHRPNGSLLAYDPASQETLLLLDDLYFANGIAVSHDESFVLVNETWKYRVLRYWLSGDKQGTTEVFIDNLPAFPDGISRGSEGVFWLALVSPRSSLLDMLSTWPFVRKIVDRLPSFLQPSAQRYAAVAGLDSEGRVVYNLQDPEARSLATIASAEEVDGILYLGSLEEPAFGRIPVPSK